MAVAVLVLVASVVVVASVAAVGVLVLALLSSCSCWCRQPQFSLVFRYSCLLVDSHFLSHRAMERDNRSFNDSMYGCRML